MSDILIKSSIYIAIIILGFTMKTLGVFKQEDFPILSKIILKITLPAAIATNLSDATIIPSMLEFTLIGLGFGVIYMVFGALLPAKDRDERAFNILNIPGYNIGNFMLPFCSTFLTSTGLVVTSLLDFGNSIVVLGGAKAVAETQRDANRSFSFVPLLRQMSKSIPFLTYLVMISLNLMHIQLPSPVFLFTSTLGATNAPLALLMIGIGFKVPQKGKDTKKILTILSIRYGFAFVACAAVLLFIPFEFEIKRVICLMALAPIGNAVPAYTEEMKMDYGLSSTINSISIIISIILMTAMLIWTSQMA